MSSENVKFFHQKKFSKAITMIIIKINKIVYNWRNKFWKIHKVVILKQWSGLLYWNIQYSCWHIKHSKMTARCMELAPWSGSVPTTHEAGGIQCPVTLVSRDATHTFFVVLGIHWLHKHAYRQGTHP